LWARRTDAATIEPQARVILKEAARAVLDSLYPGALADPAVISQ
jgi:hypothetical protein